jgi:hypothetical protein
VVEDNLLDIDCLRLAITMRSSGCCPTARQQHQQHHYVPQQPHSTLLDILFFSFNTYIFSTNIMAKE